MNRGGSETATRLRMVAQHGELTHQLAVKDQVIWQLLQEREAHEAARKALEARSAALWERSSAELREWQELTDRMARELTRARAGRRGGGKTAGKVAGGGCLDDGAAARETRRQQGAATLCDSAQEVTISAGEEKEEEATLLRQRALRQRLQQQEEQMAAAASAADADEQRQRDLDACIQEQRWQHDAWAPPIASGH